MRLLPAPPPPSWSRREGSTGGRVATDAQPVALPRGWPDGRRIRRWRRCSAGNSAAAYPTAVVGASSPVAVDADIAGGRGRPSGARRPSVAGGGLLTACWRQCRKSCRAQADPHYTPAPPICTKTTLRLGRGIASGGPLAWQNQWPLSFLGGLRGLSAPGHAPGAACGKRGS